MRELCCGAITGMGESLEQRAELAVQLAELGPHEVPLNFLNPRPGTPLADRSTGCLADPERVPDAVTAAAPAARS